MLNAMADLPVSVPDSWEYRISGVVFFLKKREAIVSVICVSGYLSEFEGPDIIPLLWRGAPTLQGMGDEFGTAVSASAISSVEAMVAGMNRELRSAYSTH